MAVCIDSGGQFISLDATFLKCIKKEYAEYVIQISGPSSVTWTIKRRYRQFLALHEKLIKSHGFTDVPFPPKKTFNNLSTEFLVRRQTELHIYLRAVLQHFPLPPKVLADFIEWDKYEIHGITTALAKHFFDNGTNILNSAFPFELSVYQIHAINQRMKSSAPTNFLSESVYDFGNVRDFVSQIESVKIRGSSEMFLHSNIVMNNLCFDLSPFTSLIRLEMIGVDIRRLLGYNQLKTTVMSLIVHQSLDNLRNFMLGDLYSVGKGEWVFGSDPVTTKGWDRVTTADFSSNYLHGLDPSIALMRNIERLDLSHNNLTDVNHLDILSHLTCLILSYNKLFCMDDNLGLLPAELATPARRKGSEPSASLDPSTPSTSTVNPPSSAGPADTGASASSGGDSTPTPALPSDSMASSASDSTSTAPPRAPINRVPTSMLLHTRLGNIKELRLDHNELKSALLVDKLYSLQILDLSFNKIVSFVDILCLGRLKCLEQLFLHHNPICEEPNYRRDAFHTLGNNFAEVSLDGVRPSKTEVEMVLLLRALKLGQSTIYNLNYQFSLEHVNRLPSVTSNRQVVCSINIPLDLIEHMSSMQSSENNKQKFLSVVHQLHRSYFGLENVKLLNFILYSLFSATCRHHTVSDLVWCLASSMHHDEISEPEPLCLAVSAQDSTIMPFKLKKIRQRTSGGRLSMDSSGNQTYQLIPCSPISTAQEVTQLVVDADENFLRLDHVGLDGEMRTDLYLLRRSLSLSDILANPQDVQASCPDTEESFPSPQSILISSILRIDAFSNSIRTSASALQNGPQLVCLSVESRVSQLVVFLNQWRRDMSLPPLKESDLVFVRRALLRFENGFTAVYTVVLASDDLHLVDERLNELPKPLLPNPDAAKFPLNRQTDWRLTSCSPPPTPVSRQFSKASITSTVPTFGRMGHYPINRLSFIPLLQSSGIFNSADVAPLPIIMPYPEFEHQIMVKIKPKPAVPISPRPSNDSHQLKQSSNFTASARRYSSSASSSSALAISRLNIGFELAKDAILFSEKLDHCKRRMPENGVKRSSSNEQEDTETSQPSEQKEHTLIKPESDVQNALELVPFRYYDESKNAFRIPLISHPKLRNLACKSPRELIKWYRENIVTGVLPFSISHSALSLALTMLSPSSSPTPSTPPSPALPPSDTEGPPLLQAIWTGCLLPGDSRVRPTLLLGTGTCLYLVTEESRVPRESAPESDRMPTSLITSRVMHLNSKVEVHLGVCYQWLWLTCTPLSQGTECQEDYTTSSDRDTHPPLDYEPSIAVIVTANFNTTRRLLEYLRRIDALNVTQDQFYDTHEDKDEDDKRPEHFYSICDATEIPDAKESRSNTEASWEVVVPSPSIPGVPPRRTETFTSGASGLGCGMYYSDSEEAHVECLGGGRLTIHHFPPPQENIESLLKTIFISTQFAPDHLHHFVLVDEARCDLDDLGSSTSPGQMQETARVIGVALTDRFICLIEYIFKWYRTDTSLEDSDQGHNTSPSFVVLHVGDLYDLISVSSASYDPRLIILRFTGIPPSPLQPIRSPAQKLDANQYPNYYSAKSGLDAEIDPVQVEIAVASEFERKTLVHKIRLCWNKGDQETL